MQTLHDDVPHPVPPFAYLRYKENWFFVFMDIGNSVYGIAHFNCEPGFDRVRFSCNLLVRGKLFKYINQLPFPADFAMSPEIGDDKLKAKFIEAHTRIDLRFDSDDVELDVSFLKHAPTFDYGNYDAANPGKPSVQEILNFATNQMFHHQQQGMDFSGTLKLKTGAGAGETIALKGIGMRDHTRGMRADNMILRHVWSYLCFPQTVFGAMSMTGSTRPGLTASSGYVYDAGGMRSLREIAINNYGEAQDNMPGTVEFKLDDVYGKPYTVIADIGNRLGYVPHFAEKPDSNGYCYDIVENFCPVTLRETGEQGHALVEIGHQRKK